MDELNEILKNFMCELEKRCPASPSIFKLWFGDFKLVYLDEKKAVFTTPTSLRRKMISAYDEIIVQTLNDLLGFPIEVEIKSEDDNNKFSDKRQEQIAITPPEVIEKAKAKEKYDNALLRLE